jgi:hypothetical protein
VVLHSYTAPGNGHGILEWPRLIEHKPVEDVHCRNCRDQ